MKDIAKSSDIKSLIVDVSEEIKKKNLLDFVYTSLDINNINYSSNDIIYSNFLKYSKQYQFFVFPNNFKYMVIELLNDEHKSASDSKNLNAFNLYVSKSFFVIYEDTKLYAYKVLNQKYTKDELLNFIEKSFNISISSIFEINDSILKKLEENTKNTKQSFININKKNNKSFLLFIIYVLLCILTAFIYETYERKDLENKKIEKIRLEEDEYLKISKTLKFKPFATEYKKFISTAKEFNLKILSFDYNSESIRIKLSTKKKKSIYSFLNEYQKSLIGNNIIEDESKKLFVSTINVKPN